MYLFLNNFQLCFAICNYIFTSKFTHFFSKKILSIVDISFLQQIPYFCNPKSKKQSAGVVKLVDTLDLGSSAVRHGGSSPSTRTKVKLISGEVDRCTLQLLLINFLILNNIQSPYNGNSYKRKHR